MCQEKLSDVGDQQDKKNYLAGLDQWSLRGKNAWHLWLMRGKIPRVGGQCLCPHTLVGSVCPPLHWQLVSVHPYIDRQGLFPADFLNWWSVPVCPYTSGQWLAIAAITRQRVTLIGCVPFFLRWAEKESRLKAVCPLAEVAAGGHAGKIQHKQHPILNQYRTQHFTLKSGANPDYVIRDGGQPYLVILPVENILS